MGTGTYATYARCGKGTTRALGRWEEQTVPALEVWSFDELRSAWEEGHRTHLTGDCR